MNHWSLLDFDIIGFASVVETPTLPRVLPLVFRKRDESEKILLPPFNLIFDEIFGATESDSEELEDLIAKEQITRLPEPMPGKIAHDLWVNENGKVSYNPKAEVQEAFKDIFTKHLESARKALEKKDYAAAGRHAAVARAVNPTHLDPLVIRAATEQLTGKTSQVNFTRHLASSHISVDRFDRMMAEIIGESAKEVRGAMVMREVALIRSRQAA